MTFGELWVEDDFLRDILHSNSPSCSEFFRSRFQSKNITVGTRWLSDANFKYLEYACPDRRVPDNKVHGANMGPSGADRTQVGPMLAPWTLLSGCFVTLPGLHDWRSMDDVNSVDRNVGYVRPCISNQASCMETKSHWHYLIHQLYSQQAKLSMTMWKYPRTYTITSQYLVRRWGTLQSTEFPLWSFGMLSFRH